MSRPVVSIEMGLVVPARDVHLGGKTVGDGVIGLVEAGGDGSARVLAMTDRRQHTGQPRALRTGLIPHLVADAPHHDAGMIAVAPDHGAQVLLCPFVEQPVIPVGHFGDLPLIKGLIHNHQPQLVADLKQLG